MPTKSHAYTHTHTHSRLTRIARIHVQCTCEPNRIRSAHVFAESFFRSHTDSVAAFPFENRWEREPVLRREREREGGGSTAGMAGRQLERVSGGRHSGGESARAFALPTRSAIAETAKQHQQQHHRHIKARNVCAKLFS